MLTAVTTEQSREIVLKKSAIPLLGEDDVLVKVSYCGVCGSDLHAYSHAKGYEFVQHPRILGHEIAGEVVAVGKKQNEKTIGQKVIVQSMHYCGTCENCRNGRYSICIYNEVIGLHFDGGMAEYVKTNMKYINGIGCLKEHIAVLTEPMAVAVHAIKKVEEVSEENTVIVQGAGIIGFFLALLCVDKGAKTYITGLKQDEDTRLNKFREFEMLTHIVEEDLMKEQADIVFECSGSNAGVTSAFQHLKKGGKAVFVALYEEESSIFLTDLVRKEWPIIPSYGSDPTDYEEAIAILTKYADQLEGLMSYYPFEQVDLAFQDSLQQQVLKAIIAIND